MQLFIELLMQLLSMSIWHCNWWGDDTTRVLQFPKARRDILVWVHDSVYIFVGIDVNSISISIYLRIYNNIKL